MKKYVLILPAVFLFSVCLAQPKAEISIGYCHEMAEKNHPLAAQFELIEQVTDLKVKNLNKNYLPDLDLNGSAHYQSDVTKVPTRISVPEFQIQPIDKDWYKITLDLQQTIYDGGATKRSKHLEEAEHQVAAQEARVEIYKVKEQINTVFFNILSFQENLRILDLHTEVLEKRMSEVDAAVKNGVLLEADLVQLQAEMIKIEQGRAEIRIAKDASQKILSELIGEKIPEGSSFIVPAKTFPEPNPERNRPEYTLMDYEQLKLEVMKEMAVTKDIPKFFGFGQLGYGRPGYDMLNNNFDDFYMIGLKMNWNIYGWGKTRNEKEILDLNKEMIENRRRDFERAITIQSEETLSEIEKYRMFIENDREILSLREKITKTYESQLKNGVITSAEYISQLNAESEARLNLKLHEIQLSSAIIEFRTTIGDL
jgi:outer membrane protein TolC